MNLLDTLLTSTIALDALVGPTINAINQGLIRPYMDPGGPLVFWVTPTQGLGSVIITAFDRETSLGLESWSIRWGSASRFGDLIRREVGRSPVALTHTLLPWRPDPIPVRGEVNP